MPHFICQLGQFDRFIGLSFFSSHHEIILLHLHVINVSLSGLFFSSLFLSIRHPLVITMFSLSHKPTYLQDGEAYAYLLNALAPEHCSTATLETKDPNARAKMVLDQAEKLDCKRYLSPKDIVEGSPNLNLAFVAQIFQHRQELAFLFSPYTSCLVKDYIDGLWVVYYIALNKSIKYY